MQITSLYTSEAYDNPIVAELRANSFQRTIGPDLLEIQDLLLLHSNFTDEISEAIRNWHASFTSFLRNRDLQSEIERHIFLLQEILVDCKSLTPLDKGSVYGSDGKTYGLKSLSVYLSEVPEEQRNKSPFNPSSDVIFFTMPHPIVNHMVEWLERHDALLHSEDLERAYQILEDHHSVPSLPTFNTEVIQRVSAPILQTQETVIPTQGLLSQRIERVRAQMRENAFRELLQQIHENTERGLVRTDETLTRMITGQEALNHAIEGTREQIQQLRTENRALEEQLSDVEQRITNAEAENKKLQMAINEAQKRNKKRKKRWMKELAKTAGFIALGVLGTIAIQAALASAGVAGTGTVYPSLGGGSFSYTRPI